MDTPPLVSCIMPTFNRRTFVPRAITYFLRQDYPNKELIIADDGDDAVNDLVPDDPQIKYVRLLGRRTLGAKRNECVAACRGDLIMHWDDDDWMAAHRITYQVDALLRGGGDVCGTRQMLFYELATGNSWLYDYPPHARLMLTGGSLLYTKEFWRRSPFPNCQVGSDTRFILRRKLDRAVCLPDYHFYVAMIHPGNTSRKVCKGTYWSRRSGDVQTMMGEDGDFYRSFLVRERNATVSRYHVDVPTWPKKNDAALHSTEGTRMGLGPLQWMEARSFPMRIGYVLTNFPPLSETFIRREILALCQAGEQVFVYASILRTFGKTAYRKTESNESFLNGSASAHA